MPKKKKYEIIMTTYPPRDRIITQEEYDVALDKAINLILDDLILNGHLESPKELMEKSKREE